MTALEVFMLLTVLNSALIVALALQSLRHHSSGRGGCGDRGCVDCRTEWGRP